MTSRAVFNWGRKHSFRARDAIVNERYKEGGPQAEGEQGEGAIVVAQEKVEKEKRKASQKKPERKPPPALIFCFEFRARVAGLIDCLQNRRRAIAEAHV